MSGHDYAQRSMTHLAAGSEAGDVTWPQNSLLTAKGNSGMGFSTTGEDTSPDAANRAVIFCCFDFAAQTPSSKIGGLSKFSRGGCASLPNLLSTASDPGVIGSSPSIACKITQLENLLLQDNERIETRCPSGPFSRVDANIS